MTSSQAATVRPRDTEAPSLYWEARAAWEATVRAPAPVAGRPLVTERMVWGRLAWAMLAVVVAVEVLLTVL